MWNNRNKERYGEERRRGRDRSRSREKCREEWRGYREYRSGHDYRDNEEGRGREKHIRDKYTQQKEYNQFGPRSRRNNLSPSLSSESENAAVDKPTKDDILNKKELGYVNESFERILRILEESRRKDSWEKRKLGNAGQKGILKYLLEISRSIILQEGEEEHPIQIIPTGGKEEKKKKVEHKGHKKHIDISPWGAFGREKESGNKGEYCREHSDQKEEIPKDQVSPLERAEQGENHPPLNVHEVPEIGPQPLLLVNTDGKPEHYGDNLFKGEGEAMAEFIKSGKRIPRRGEVGWTADQILKYENLGYVMSGSRNKRLEYMRQLKEQQVYIYIYIYKYTKSAV